MTTATAVDIGALLAPHVDPDNGCDACGDSIPGVLVPAGNDDNHLFVQSCDACNVETDDIAACQNAARLLGCRTHRRYDNNEFRQWRPFLAAPGAVDDADFYCEGADETGWSPAYEVAVRPGWAAVLRCDEYVGKTIAATEATICDDADICDHVFDPPVLLKITMFDHSSDVTGGPLDSVYDTVLWVDPVDAAAVVALPDGHHYSWVDGPSFDRMTGTVVDKPTFKVRP